MRIENRGINNKMQQYIQVLVLIIQYVAIKAEFNNSYIIDRAFIHMYNLETLKIQNKLIKIEKKEPDLERDIGLLQNSSLGVREYLIRQGGYEYGPPFLQLCL